MEVKLMMMMMMMIQKSFKAVLMKKKLSYHSRVDCNQLQLNLMSIKFVIKSVSTAFNN